MGAPNEVRDAFHNVTSSKYVHFDKRGTWHPYRDRLNVPSEMMPSMDEPSIMGKVLNEVRDTFHEITSSKDDHFDRLTKWHPTGGYPNVLSEIMTFMDEPSTIEKSLTRFEIPPTRLPLSRLSTSICEAFDTPQGLPQCTFKDEALYRWIIHHGRIPWYELNTLQDNDKILRGNAS